MAALQRNHTVLLSIQQAINTVPTQAESVASDGITVPSPRKRTVAKSGTGKRAQPKKKTAPKSGATAAGKKDPIKAAGAEAPKTTQPTLVGLVRGYLFEQSEPRSAAEIATALGQAHPERGVKTTVVRTTLEGLVAKNQAQRTRQGTSVFYTTAAKPQTEAVDS
ncbi:hypothetical protein J2X68_007738 [Streptomyces sp. 3330]|uniref:hypothetical protein n=1 Tax=Streptomyces sp. 3330 TaxID=2817755 RepID=UPI00285C2A90|nr:hypothetical protein [Streptomyces sp. 3330]MDR6980996.1 hypothetical protein [Streptomyces sp. 3330]